MSLQFREDIFSPGRRCYPGAAVCLDARAASAHATVRNERPRSGSTVPNTPARSSMR